MNDQWYIYPIVRQFITGLSRFLCSLIVVSALMALTEFLLMAASESYLLPALFCGNLSDILFALILIGMTIIAAWSHQVLLAGRGLLLTRILCHTAIILSIAYFICRLYTTFTGTALLIRQAEAPYIIWGILLLTAILNLGNMSAAPITSRVLLFALLISTLAVIMCEGPELWIFGIAAKILLLFISLPVFKRLATTAVAVIAMPEP